MITLDGSQGEGGGQILRTALSLSLVTGEPFAIEHIRAKRPKPGLLRQHLTAVQAAARFGSARVEGAELGSTSLRFTPGRLVGGEHHFAMGTAGSTTLVLQTLLPALLAAPGPSRVVLEGGTHNPFAPPFDFLDRAFVPLLRRMGARVELVLKQPGFFPAGGGTLICAVEPGRLAALHLPERGALRAIHARAMVCNLPASIARRELEALRAACPEVQTPGEVISLRGPGPGNALVAELELESLSEVFVALGEKGTSAEQVGEQLGAEVRRYLSAGAPVGEHLADQLLLPLALGAGGTFRTVEPSGHTRTQMETLGAFLGAVVQIHRLDPGTWEVTVSGRA